ncbi:CBM35 domain-containing protein [Kitasatospora sp. NPDC056138]|uniref:CBM35 domain-containing protein n=1 Tax=Kitasatospora sp. NPDC056138 TaxID=3345724 RepID=UPI0035DB198F
MTTDGSNGAPESAAKDDPFAYLYRPAEGESAPDTTPVPGQPRTSYARPMEVGRAQYGQQPRPPYGQQQPSVSPTVQVPQQPNRYAEHSRPQPGEERSSGGRGKAAVIGVVAVIAAVAIGGGIALSGGDAGKSDNGAKPANSHSAPASQGASPSAAGSSAAPSVAPPSKDPIADASKLQLQGAAVSSTIKNAVSKDGSYVTLTGGPGSSLAWTIAVPTAGQYRFWVHYNNPGADIPATVLVNGTESATGPVMLKNYTHSSDPDQAWTRGAIWPQLPAGTVTLTVSVPAGSSVAIDQVAIKQFADSTAPW